MLSRSFDEAMSQIAKRTDIEHTYVIGGSRVYDVSTLWIVARIALK